MTLDGLLSQGIAAAKAGQREQARDLLMQAIELDERNEKVWLWLSGVVDTDEDRCVCLENVLALNPDNAWARRGLERLLPGLGPQTSPTPQVQAAPASSRPFEPATVEPPPPAVAQPERPPRARQRAQEMEEPRGFERLRDTRRKRLKPALILLASILVPTILLLSLAFIPITWRAAINETIGFPLLGVVSVERAQMGRDGRIVVKAAGPSSEFRKSHYLQVSDGETVVIQYTVEVRQGKVTLSLDRDDLDILDEDFWAEGVSDIMPWSDRVETSQTQTVRVKISRSGRYRVWMSLWKFEGQIDLQWQIE